MLINFNNPKYSIVIYMKGCKSLAFEIYFNNDPDLKNMFLVKETFTPLGNDKELQMFFENVREYFLDIFSTYQDFINFIMMNKELKFYNYDLGIIFNQEKCAKCTKLYRKGVKLDEECEKLIKNKCYDNFRLGAYYQHKHGISEDIDIKQRKEQTYEEKIKDFQEKWICSVCNFANDKKDKECKVCLQMAKDFENIWLCPNPSCGYGNDNRNLECELCNTKKPSTANKQKPQIGKRPKK